MVSCFENKHVIITLDVYFLQTPWLHFGISLAGGGSYAVIVLNCTDILT